MWHIPCANKGRMQDRGKIVATPLASCLQKHGPLGRSACQSACLVTDQGIFYIHINDIDSHIHCHCLCSSSWQQPI